MLTNTQKGMLAHCIDLRLAKLIEYFVGRKEQEYIDVVKFINNALEENCAKELTRYKCSSDETHLQLSMKLIKSELRGIFMADRKMLEKLSIINNPRDRDMKVTRENFKNIASALKQAANDTLERIVNRTPKLRLLKDEFTIIAHDDRENNNTKRRSGI